MRFVVGIFKTICIVAVLIIFRNEITVNFFQSMIKILFEPFFYISFFVKTAHNIVKRIKW